MELERAREIIQALADGVDPYTGEHFPADGPYQRTDTVRALYTILEAATCPGEVPGRSLKPVDPNKPRAGGKWTDEEEQRLHDAFATNTPVADIARDHGRTRGAITARLVKLGLVEDSPTNRVGQGNRPPPVATEPPPTSQSGPGDPDDCPF